MFPEILLFDFFRVEKKKKKNQGEEESTTNCAAELSSSPAYTNSLLSAFKHLARSPPSQIAGCGAPDHCCLSSM
jgi:hypothetical protein